MIVSGVLSVFPANADTLTEVTLTPEQTLALFGQTLNCTYKTQTGSSTCTFTYRDTVNASSNWTWAYSGGAPAWYRDYVRATNFLEYICPKSSISGSVSSSGAYINAPFSIDIQRISLFHAPILCSGDQDSPGRVSPSSYPQNVSLISSYSPNEPVVRDFYYHANSQYLYGRMDMLYIPYDENTWIPEMDEKYCCAEVIANSQSETENTSFDVSGLEMNFFFYPVLRGSATDPSQEYYYVLLIGCPTLTDGYNAPAITTAPIDYSPVLSDINSGVGDININLNGVNNRLDAILQKLDAIYARMAQNMPNPSLSPAQTISTDLQQYYSGIASGAPSASAINDYTGGASIIPFSSILSASGLGGLFGVLVGVACAGWVLTRGRGG